MKFKISQSEFAKSLSNVSRVVGARTTLPVLNNILIQVKDNKIKLSATDLEVAIITETKGEIESDGEATVPSRLLNDFVNNNNDKNIEFNLAKGNKLGLKSEHFSANLNGISAEEFPTIPSLPEEVFSKIERDEFISLLLQMKQDRY